MKENNKSIDKELRTIFINQPDLNLYCDNKVKTAKYNIFTFLPFAIFYQFNNYFNIFFLLTAIILSIKIISPMDPGVAIGPFIFVISISILREGIEDYKKAKYDQTYNNSKVKLVNSNNKDEVIKWGDVKVGNIIKFEKNEIIAADVLILKTSDKNNIAFMQTTNLDGENSLKQKEGLSILSELLDKNEGKFNNLRGTIKVDHPNDNIYKTFGNIELDNQKYIFNNENILLRASTLKNVDYVYGIVIYTGKDTKAMKNIQQSSLKTSSIERTLNKVIIAVIIVVFSICVACTMFGMIFMSTSVPNIETHNLNAYYIYYSSDDGQNYTLEFFKLFGSYFIIFNNIIPISLTITFEIAKGIQVSIMERDKRMKNPNENFKVLSLKIHEDLGNVRYIFSDKTGTLTRNELEFKACSIINRLFIKDKEKNPLGIDFNKPEDILNANQDCTNNNYGNNQHNESNSRKVSETPDNQSREDLNINRNLLNNLNKAVVNTQSYFSRNLNKIENINGIENVKSKYKKENDLKLNNVNDHKENFWDKKSLKKSMFTPDFPIEQLKHALKVDYPINLVSNLNHISSNNLNTFRNEFINQKIDNDKDNSQENHSINSIDLLNKNFTKSNFFHKNNTRYLNSSKELIKELFLNIALNHNVLLSNEDDFVNYQGPNPDEVALASCAYELGIKFIEKDSNKNIIKIQIFDEMLEFEVLFKIPFESAKKRSSIVIREVKSKENHIYNQTVKIYIKGADNIIFDLIDENSKKQILPTTKEHLDLFAKEGLRTLCYTVKYISYEDFFNWKANYNSLINKANANLAETHSEIDNLIHELEKNSILLGVTGLEDKLQESVKETINEFIEAKIHMWMLTGDNIDTAESIGHSSNIFNDDTEVFKLKASETKEELKDKLQAILKELDNMEKEIMRLKLERKKRIKKTKNENEPQNENKDVNALNSNEYINDNYQNMNLNNIFYSQTFTKKTKINQYNQPQNNPNHSHLIWKNPQPKTLKESCSDKNFKKKLFDSLESDRKNHSDDYGKKNKQQNQEFLNFLKNTDLSYRVVENFNIKESDNYVDNNNDLFYNNDPKRLVFNNYMNHSYDDISHTKHRNKLKETFDNVFTSMNQKINQEGGIQREKNSQKQDASDSSSDDMDDISVMKFLLERNFFENSNTKLLGNMTFLNKLFEMSNKDSQINLSNKEEIKENLKQVVEYLIENKNKKHDLTPEGFSIEKIQKAKINFNNNNEEYGIKIVSANNEDDSSILNSFRRKKYQIDKDINNSPLKDPESINQEISRRNYLNFKIKPVPHEPQELKPSMSPLQIYKNIENKNRNIDDLVNNLKQDNFSESAYNNEININYSERNFSTSNIQNNLQLKHLNNLMQLNENKNNNNKRPVSGKDKNIHFKLKGNILRNLGKLNCNPSSALNNDENLNVVDINHDKDIPNRDKILHVRGEKNKFNNIDKSNNEYNYNEQNSINNQSDQLNNKSLEKEKAKDLLDNSNYSIKSGDRSTKQVDLSTIYEFYQKELNRYKTKKENAKKILKFANFNFKDMKEKKPEDEIFEIPEIDLLNFGIIIEGDAISHCLENDLAHMFWKLIKKSRSVICCRCNPIQKSQIVNFVKNKSSDVCLAIGDGGNDVNMIKAANIGVGIFGKEGYQAAFSSDYAISEFKYLKRLLFYHGRYFILRNSYFIYFFFYKSLIFNVPNLWFAFFSGFSGTLLWDAVYFLLYTSILTTMPPVVPMVFEEDIDINLDSYPNKENLKHLIPDIYKETRDSSPFNSLKFLIVFIMGCLHSGVIYFFPMFVFGNGSQDHLGRSYTLWDYSLLGIVTVLFVQYYILIQDTFLFSLPVYIAHGVQIIVLIVFFNIYACFGSDELGLYTYDVISNIKFWFTFLVILVIALIPVIISRKVEFFLTQNIINNLRNRNFEDDYTRKICIKKIEQMHKCSRSLAKFRKIYKAKKKNSHFSVKNLADKKMKDYVDQYENAKKMNKINKNINNSNEISQPYIDNNNTNNNKNQIFYNNNPNNPNAKNLGLALDSVTPIKIRKSNTVREKKKRRKSVEILIDNIKLLSSRKKNNNEINNNDDENEDCNSRNNNECPKILKFLKKASQEILDI